MISAPVLIASAVLLGLGTFAFRAVGPLLHARIRVSPSVQSLMSMSATVLLVALAATAAIFDGSSPAGWARVSGVAVAVVLAWRRAPFVVIVLAAAGTAAGLRALGV
ncbi:MULTISPECIES: AzlD domain-containing protein [unclassified Nocardioides]|uniref:AzlD domain-containing protein n=1 Tax=unclassified Nocardioides TaxID=2615069 RepID=UPI0006F7EC38|nr:MULTISPECIES: AzlD domain-containing protein [unclassified Nocardioides]KQY57573.1 branched-chain amino acid transporter [Nocardioides sp. Root140]KQZ76058.1 branched-chain amino acid transporter [Nocardioides sp. Root151]